MSTSPQFIHRDQSILVQTNCGHALLDPYTTLLGPGIPIPWKIRCTKLPLSVPYDGFPSPNAIASTSNPSKRRKITREISQNEQANIDLHNELREWLPGAIKDVREAYIGTSATTWYSRDQLDTSTSASTEEEKTLTNLVAWGREIAEIKALDGEVEDQSNEEEVKELDGSANDGSMSSLFESIHANYSMKQHILKTPATDFLIPPRSAFLMADMIKWYDLLSGFTAKETFNVVLLDPPWRSKSVRRSAHYEEMDMYDLYKIRLPDLLQESANHHPVLIGVWVTNHTKCRRFIRDKFLPSMGISKIVHWYWVKITAGEEEKEMESGCLPVWSFDGPSPRRCYEGLMLGYYNPNELPVKEELPDKRAFLSVPLEHSRKPLVIDLLKPYIQGEGIRVLEMFARYIPSGLRGSIPADEDTTRSNCSDLWLSVGNEPLKYNEIGVQMVNG